MRKMVLAIGALAASIILLWNVEPARAAPAGAQASGAKVSDGAQGATLASCYRRRGWGCGYYGPPVSYYGPPIYSYAPPPVYYFAPPALYYPYSGPSYVYNDYDDYEDYYYAPRRRARYWARW
jgi:hypothetical protein